MSRYYIPIWKTAPLIRLLIPMITGIILQWKLRFTFDFLAITGLCLTPAFLLFYYLPLTLKFRLRFLQSALLFLLIICFAMFVTWNKDVRHQSAWFGHKYQNNCYLVVRINEPLVKKAKTFKAEGVVERIIINKQEYNVNGEIFIYFLNDSAVGSLNYGDRLLLNKPLQQIRNSGNPGAFDYERYASFQQIFHSVYLGKNEWVLLASKNQGILKKMIFSMRAYVLRTLKTYIGGDKNVLGIAEALLIGYKEDLDKDLVQAYSNAGVVHIIAISGLHLGLIYVLLVWLFNRLPFIKKIHIIKVILILGCLWIFSLITGASASVLRSAVMFSCIVAGKFYNKESSIYNSLAVSAFILLCYDPYFLWDVGFQLSYLAVTGIVIFQKPFVNLLYVKNKWLNKIGGMIAITFAAQLATFPLCLYYFHQFPNLFFITNLVAVPLSTLILFAEIFVIAFSWIPLASVFAGKLTAALIWLMNFVISACNDLPFSLWDNIYANVMSTWLLYFFIISISGWLLYRKKMMYRYAMISLLVFTSVHIIQYIKTREQKKIVIYNIPKHSAIEFVYQDKYYFQGDTVLLNDGFMKNFHLKPAHIAMQANKCTKLLTGFSKKNNLSQFFKKRLVQIDTSLSFLPLTSKIRTDFLVISKNANIKIADMIAAIDPAIIIFDSSNSLWKIAKWKKECEGLALPCFSVPEQGAFVLDVK